MFFSLDRFPQWVLERSDFLRTLCEDTFSSGSSDGIMEIPSFLPQYTSDFDFADLFMKDAPYVNTELFISIYEDGRAFLDFIGFDITTSIFKPDLYDKSIIPDHLYATIYFDLIGLEKYGLGFIDYDDCDKTLAQSISQNQRDWVDWFLSLNIRNADMIQNHKILELIHFGTVKVEMIDWLMEKWNPNIFSYPCVCQSIVFERNAAIFAKYKSNIYQSYHKDGLMRIGFIRSPYDRDDATHLKFLQLMEDNGRYFHFDYETVDHAYKSDNILIIQWIFERNREYMKECRIAVIKKLYHHSLASTVPYETKMAILDFFLTHHGDILSSDQLIEETFHIHPKISYDHIGHIPFDYAFIRTLIERTGHAFNKNAYILALVLRNDLFHEMILNYMEEKKDSCEAFQNTFHMVIERGNIEYIRFYMTHRLYREDTIGVDYLEAASRKCGSYEVFKLLYKSGFRSDDHDALFLTAYQNAHVSHCAFMIQYGYEPSDKVKHQIITQWKYEEAIYNSRAIDDEVDALLAPEGSRRFADKASKITVYSPNITDDEHAKRMMILRMIFETNTFTADSNSAQTGSC